MVRDLDMVVFGATGDTGVVGCCYLFFQGKRLGITSWAPAARNLGKLKKDVLDRFQGVESGPDGLLPAEPIEADANDYQSLVNMCARTKCVIACAGPFAQYGEGVVRACVEAGTNYVDVTGEMPWVEKMARRYGQEAEKKGISIVSCAGYDSIPPDLTTYLAAKALEKEGEQLQRFEAFVGGAGGALPSGTLDTVLSGVDAGKRQVLRTVTFGVLGNSAAASRKKAVEAPLPDASSKESKFVPPAEQSNLKKNLIWTMIPAYSQLGGQFCLPHFMAPINVNTVHHTAAKSGYGGFEYRERMAGLPRGALSLFGLVPTLIGIVGAIFLGVMMALPGFSTLALKLRDWFNTPLQQRTRDRVFNGFKSTGKTYVHGYGVSKSGRRVSVKMHSKYDPGLGYTMLSACTIAAQLVQRAGTSAKAKSGCNSAVVALGGEALADALRASGVTLEVSMPVNSKL